MSDTAHRQELRVSVETCWEWAWQSAARSASCEGEEEEEEEMIIKICQASILFYFVILEWTSDQLQHTCTFNRLNLTFRIEKNFKSTQSL